MLDALIAGGAKLLGGFLGQESAEENAAQNRALQREFAQNAIQWKVDDAKKAGIHPLYALGASTTSFSPVSVGTPLADSISSMGADVGRAVNAVSTQGQRDTDFQNKVKELALTKGGLENELLASQIAQLKASQSPPFPSATGGSNDPVEGRSQDWSKRLPNAFESGSGVVVGGDYAKNPWFMDAQKYEDRYGDIVENVGGITNLIADWYYSNPSAGPWLRALTRRSEGMSNQQRSR